MGDRSHIEVFADVWCPFTHVGLRRLVEERAARGRDDVTIRVRSWPLELINGEPLSPTFVAEEVEALRAEVASDLFGDFRPEHMPQSTLPALRLTEAAYRQSLAVGEAVALELRDRLFERGEDVQDEALLAAVAEGHDVDVRPVEPDPVVRSLAEGRARGVVGSPHFFLAGEGWFCPALDVRRVDDQLLVRPDPEAFEDFVSRCFGAAGSAVG